MNNPMPKDNEVDEKVPVYVATAPERIFLQVADDAYYAEDPFPIGEEVTWCADSVMALEVAYRREDLHAATVAELRAEVERRKDALAAMSQFAKVAEQRAAAAERRVGECLKFIDGIRDELHNRRTADWFPEGAHNAAAQMSEDMRLLGNACADFDPYTLTGADPT